MLVIPMALQPTDTLTLMTSLLMATVTANAISFWHSSANRRLSLRRRPKNHPLRHPLHLLSLAHRHKLRLPLTTTITTSSTFLTLLRERRKLAQNQAQVRRHPQHRPSSLHIDQPNPELPHHRLLSHTYRLTNSKTPFSTCSRSLPTSPARR